MTPDERFACAARLAADHGTPLGAPPACPAFLAMAARSSGDSLAARAAPPSFPRATAAGFLMFMPWHP
jgi:hypothetical protein